MRLAIIADIHGNAVALETVVADLRGQDPDAVVCLGDAVFKGPNEYTSGHLKRADQEWLANPPITETLQLEGVQVELFHASAWSMDVAILPWAAQEELCALPADRATNRAS